MNISKFNTTLRFVLFCSALLYSVFSVNAQTITLESPNGSEVWEANSTHDIVWTGSGINGNIYIEYSTNNGQSWNYLYWAWSADTGGTLSWNIPFVESTNAKIKLTYWDNQSVTDISDNVFEISMPDFAVVYPNGGETFYATQVKNIQWIANNSNTLLIEYSTDNAATWQTVASNVSASSQSYQWTIPNTPSYFCMVRITDENNGLIIDTSNFNFTIAPLPTINLVYPNGGETLEVGDTVQIEWTGTDLNGAVNLEFSSNNGQSWSYLAFSWSNQTGGTYSWIVPNIITSNALIKIKFYDVQTVLDSSANVFSIVLPSFALLYPGGGESFYPNQSVNIEWVAANSNNVKLEYSTDNGLIWNAIANSVAASLGSYSWTVPNSPSTTCLIKISDVDNPLETDICNQTFTINILPHITLVTPGGGASLETGQTFSIQWSGNDISGNIYLEYSTNSGATWNYISWGWSNSNGGTYDWTVPNIISSHCYIKATYWEYQAVKDSNDTEFSIQAPSFVLNTPNGNEVLYPGNQFNIQWTALNSNIIRILLSTNGGSNWTMIADSVNALLGTYSWTVPNTPSQQCLIKIIDIQNTNRNDISNNFFKINPIPTITLVSPNGGENYIVGELHNIVWTGTNLNSGIYIEASFNNGVSWQFVAWHTGNPTGGTYSWTTPNNITNQALIRVKYWDYPAAFDVSNTTFTISPPDFAFISPLGGEAYYPTNQIQIQWYANNISNLKIDYSLNGGSTWISESTSYDATLGTYLWTVPNSPSTQCKIKLTDAANTNHFIVSNIFTIKPLPVIQIVSPNGGEQIEGGVTYEIVWTGSNIDNGLNVKYSTDGGLNWLYIGSVQGTTSGGSYFWQVPYVVSSNVLIKLELWNNSNINDVSDAVFTLQMPSFALMIPNGGQVFYPLQQTTIQWSATNSIYISIEYTTNNGALWQMIEDSVAANSNSYTWTIPNTPSGDCRIRIKDINDTSKVRISTNTFTIMHLPTIHLLDPNGGEVFTGGQTETIEWTGTYLDGNIYLELSRNGGATWEFLSWATSNVNGGTFSWQVPYINSSDVIVKAKFWTVSSVFDQSDAVFTIQMPPFVLVSPNGNESLYPGNTKTIEWNASNSTYISINYSTDNGLNWLLVADSVIASSNTYTWLIPNTPSANCLIKITDLNDTLLTDISNNTFTINNLPTINIVAPNGGEVLTAGTLFDIEWTGSNINTSVYLEYSLNGGNTWQYLGWGYGNSTGGSFSWSVPFYQSQNVIIRAKLWDIQSVSDVSDVPFSIILPPFSLITPNGGYNYYPGNVISIQWIAQNTNLIKIEYSINNGNSWILVADSINASLNVYAWTIPNTPSYNCLVKLTDLNSTNFDVSNDVFTIKVLPTISLIQPNGGETWTAGDTTHIIWTGSNLDGNLIMEFSTNNWLTSTYAGGVWGWASGGSYPVTIPFINTSTAKVRVRMLEAPTVYDESDTVFSIVFPTFSLISPNGQESYYPTNLVQIKWVTAGISNVKIDYSINNGNTWINIEQSINGTTGIYDWIVPNTPSIQCLVRVTDVSNPLTYDISNSTFTIRTLPTIQLNTPLGGETMISGSTHTISWTGSNLTNAVKIYYSVDLGYSWEYIDEVWSMPNGASYQWFVPYNYTNNALVKVFSYDVPAVSSQSNSVFTIQSPPFSLIYPNGTETLYPFNEEIIQWVCTDSSLLNIEYTYDNDTTWHTLATNVHASLGQYTWNVPNTSSDFCRIRITSLNNQQTDYSDTLFVIHTLPQLSVASPNGGEILVGGTSVPVIWSGSELVEPIIVDYTLDNWATSQMINWKYGDPNGDTLDWVVPFVPTSEAKIKAYYYLAPAVKDESDNFITIVNPPFALVSPLGGQEFFPTNEVFIHWIANNTTLIKIEYSTDNGNTWSLIASNVDASMGVYSWIVPNTPSTLCKVKITDAFNPLNTSQSLTNFTIYPLPTISIVTPNGGESYIAGNTYPIKWAGTNLMGAVRLEYSTDGGSTWNYIDTFFNMNYGNTYYWQVPFEITTDALVRVNFLPITQMYDESDNEFSIVYPTFALITPNISGLNFYPTSQMNIQWVASASTYIKILFSDNYGQSWTTIADSVDASLGSYLWTIPNMPSSTCKIRIVDVDDNLIYDTSDNPFAIKFYPALTLIKPNGGENFVAGDTIKVLWTGAYLTGGLYIDYSIDTGATWHNISSKWGNPNGDYFNWIAPSILAKVLVRLTYIEIPSISDQSDSLFTICFNPELYVLNTPSICQPNTIDITNYFTDSSGVSGNISYWLDSLVTLPLTDPQHIASSGIYYIYKETDFGGCSDIIPIEVSVGTTPPLPVVASGFEVCSADTANYISASGQNIQWYADNLLTVLVDTGNAINAAQFNSDTVLYITQYFFPACPSLPANTSISYHSTPAMPATTTQPAYCAGDSINDINVTGNNINWYSDSTLLNMVYQGNLLSLNPLLHDTTFFVIQTENNCPSSALVISLIVNPIPPKPTISQVGIEIVSSSAIGNVWYNSQNVAQSTNQYFLPPVDGFYYVVVTINGCTSPASDIIYYYYTGNQMISLNNDKFLIYPNPYKNYFNIVSLAEKDLTCNIDILSVTGQSLYEQKISFDAISREQRINIEGLTDGIYFISIKNNENVYFYKIIKQ